MSDIEYTDHIEYTDLHEGDRVRATRLSDTGSRAIYEGRLVPLLGTWNSKHLSIDGFNIMVGDIATHVHDPHWVIEVLEKAPDPALKAEAVELTRIIAQNYGFADIVRDIQEAGYRKVSK